MRRRTRGSNCKAWIKAKAVSAAHTSSSSEVICTPKAQLPPAPSKWISVPPMACTVVRSCSSKPRDQSSMASGSRSSAKSVIPLRPKCKTVTCRRSLRSLSRGVGRLVLRPPCTNKRMSAKVCDNSKGSCVPGHPARRRACVRRNAKGVRTSSSNTGTNLPWSRASVASLRTQSETTEEGVHNTTTQRALSSACSISVSQVLPLSMRRSHQMDQPSCSRRATNGRTRSRSSDE